MFKHAPSSNRRDCELGIVAFGKETAEENTLDVNTGDRASFRKYLLK